jgi:hypothetical protein
MAWRRCPKRAGADGDDDEQMRPPACTLRYAHARDREAIVRLAQLVSQREPSGTLLVAESEGRVVAALLLEAGDVIADPFARTAELVEILRLRAAQLSSVSNGWRGGLRRRVIRAVRPAKAV